MAINPFTGTPEQKPTIIEKVKQIVHRSGGADLSSYYTKTQVDALIASAGVPDEAFTIVTGLRICDWSFGAFTAMDLGTGGGVAMKYTRIGREVIGWIKITIAADYTTPTGFIVVLHPDDFPIVPKVENATTGYPMPGGFGALYRAESSGGALDGFRIGMSPIVQDIGTGTSLMMFFKTGSETGIAASIDNLWSPATNNPVAADNLGGTAYFGNFRYEAKDPA